MVKTPTRESVMVPLSTHEERCHSKDAREIHNYFGKGGVISYVSRIAKPALVALPDRIS
jgi:hypothetical protein